MKCHLEGNFWPRHSDEYTAARVTHTHGYGMKLLMYCTFIVKGEFYFIHNLLGKILTSEVKHLHHYAYQVSHGSNNNIINETISNLTVGQQVAVLLLWSSAYDDKKKKKKKTQTFSYISKIMAGNIRTPA